MSLYPTLEDMKVDHMMKVNKKTFIHFSSNVTSLSDVIFNL